MAYARFGGDSDVYVYEGTNGLNCAGCMLQEREWVVDESIPLFKGHAIAVGDIIKTVYDTRSGMLTHLQVHLDAGHLVPEYALDALVQEREQLGDEL